MEQTMAKATHNNLDYITEFALKLSEKMLVSGANLERVTDTVYHICESYHCKDVHFFALNCYLNLSLESPDGGKSSGQRCIYSGMDTHLKLLGRLNQLSREVCTKKPEPEKLDDMLEDAVSTDTYSLPTILLGYLIAMVAMTYIFDGTFRDLAVILINSVLIFLAGLRIKKLVINKIIYDVLCTFMVGCVAIFFQYLGVIDTVFTVMIVNSMMLIPGIQLVNSIRNVLCGNEINGIIEFFKVIIETIAIVGGFILSIYLFAL
ncbi:MAG: threonine/serine exporter family protein [Clostridiales bacterium]|nr:threonine/serine exporter family protein [Clostridiales bacterium]